MKNKEEKIEVDIKELSNQQREEMLKKGNYARAEIIESVHNEFDTYCNIEINKCSLFEIAKLVLAMKVSIEELEKRQPELKIAVALLEKTSEHTAVEYKDGKKGRKLGE